VARGRLIVLEGLDGVGKSTVAAGLADRLGAVLRTTPSEALRRLRGPVEEALGRSEEARRLFYAAATVAAMAEAEGQIAAGRTVVLDRSLLSTIAYGRLGGSRLALDEVAALVRPADVTVFLDLDEAERRRRLAARGPGTPEEVALLDGDRAERLRGIYLGLLAHPLAGSGVAVRLDGADPEDAVAAVLEVVR
jgi:dTMP kinase